jgi:hypothetical protein
MTLKEGFVEHPQNCRPPVMPFERAWSIVELVVYISICLAVAWAVATDKVSGAVAFVVWTVLSGMRTARRRGR